jgi:hypothetical protein
MTMFAAVRAGSREFPMTGLWLKQSRFAKLIVSAIFRFDTAMIYPLHAQFANDVEGKKKRREPEQPFAEHQREIADGVDRPEIEYIGKKVQMCLARHDAVAIVNHDDAVRIDIGGLDNLDSNWTEIDFRSVELCEFGSINHHRKTVVVRHQYDLIRCRSEHE